MKQLNGFENLIIDIRSLEQNNQQREPSETYIKMNLQDITQIVYIDATHVLSLELCVKLNRFEESGGCKLKTRSAKTAKLIVFNCASIDLRYQC